MNNCIKPILVLLNIVLLARPVCAQVSDGDSEKLAWLRGIPFTDVKQVDPLLLLDENGYSVAYPPDQAPFRGQKFFVCQPVVLAGDHLSTGKGLDIGAEMNSGVLGIIEASNGQFCLPDSEFVWDVLQDLGPEAYIPHGPSFWDVNLVSGFDANASATAAGTQESWPCHKKADGTGIDWKKCLLTVSHADTSQYFAQEERQSMSDVEIVLKTTFGGVAALIGVSSRSGVTVEVNDDGATFSGLQTLDETIEGLAGKICREGYGESGNPVKSLIDQPVLAHCGGAFVLRKDRPFLLTARHCAETLVEGDSRVFAVLDYHRGSPGIDIEAGTFRSKWFIELAKDQVEYISGMDLVLIGLSDESKEKIRMLDWDGRSLDRHESLIALTFPAGVPMTPVAGKDVYVAASSGDIAFATIDGFRMASGSPVFDPKGVLVGVISAVDKADDPKLDWYLWSEPSGRKCYRPSVFDGHIEVPSLAAEDYPSATMPYVKVLTLGKLLQ